MKKPTLQIIEKYSGNVQMEEILIGAFLTKKSLDNNDLPMFIASHKKGEDSVYGKHTTI